MRNLLIITGVAALFATGNLKAQTVIPLINESSSGQLGINVQLGTDPMPFTYILDTGSAGFFTALGTTSAWTGAIAPANITNTDFTVSYGSGGLSYTGKVASADITFTDVHGAPVTVSNVQLGVIQNQPYPNWNANINHVDAGGAAAPIAPETDTDPKFYGTLGAGLYQLKNEGGNLTSVIGQIPLAPGLTKGFIIHTGGSASTSATLTLGLTKAEMDSFPIQIKMNPTTGTATNANGTTVNLYPEAQTTATYTIIKGGTTYVTTANLIMDTGGLGTHFTTGDDVNPDADLVTPDGQFIVDGASFQVAADGTTGAGGDSLADALSWLIDPTGSTKFVNQIAIDDGNAEGSLNSGIALYYTYDVFFDTDDGIIGLRPIPEPAPGLLIALAAAVVCFAVRRRQKRQRI